MSEPTLTPGWYPDPSNPEKNIYWDGHGWQSNAGGSSGLDKNKAIAVGVCILSAIGVVMSMQSVSLMSGTGTLWVGVALAGAATAVAFFLGAAKWVRVVAAVALAVALASTLYMENQLTEKRNEISQIFDN